MEQILAKENAKFFRPILSIIHFHQNGANGGGLVNETMAPWAKFRKLQYFFPLY